PVMLTLGVFHALLGSSIALTAYVASAGNLQVATARFFAAYGFVYLYGMASLTIVMATLRAVAEHQREATSADASRAALRNLRSGPAARVLLGCYGFSDHATHHRFPSIPAYNLPKATAKLGLMEREYVPRDSYWSI